MDNEMLIFNILKYCEKRNTKPTIACTESGAGKDLIANLRKGQAPSIYKIRDLAAYLGCDTSDLVGDKKEAAAIRDSQTELFMQFLGKLSDEQKSALGKILEEKKHD